MTEENENVWTREIETLIKELAKTAVTYKKLHEKESRNCHRYNNKAMYLAVAMGPLSSVIASIGAVLHPDEDKVFPLTEIGLGFLTGVVVASIKVAKFQEKSNDHKLASVKYSSLINGINFQLALPISERDNPIEFFKWVESKYDELSTNSPLLSENDNKKVENVMCKLEEGTLLNIKPPPTNQSLQYEISRLNKI